jgi:hypothetical protein
MQIEKEQVYSVKNDTYYYYIDLVDNNYVFFHYFGRIDSLPKSERIPIKIFVWMIESGEVSLKN